MPTNVSRMRDWLIDIDGVKKDKNKELSLKNAIFYLKEPGGAGEINLHAIKLSQCQSRRFIN